MNLGSDFERDSDDGLTPDMLLLDGTADEGLAFMQALSEGLETPRGAIFFDKDAGLDMRNYVADDEDPAIAAHDIQQECLKDERCAKCVVDIVVSGDAGSVRWDVTIRPSTEAGVTYELTFRVTSQSSDLITASQVTS